MSAVVVSRSYRAVRLLPTVGDVAASFGLTTVTTQPFVVRGFQIPVRLDSTFILDESRLDADSASVDADFILDRSKLY